MFRKFLHLFGVHHWSKWSKPELYRIALSPKVSAVALGQEKTCLICNEKQTRTVKVS